jgi:hypothetical protein
MAVIELIAATTTKTGLRVACELDTANYAKGIKIKKAEMRALAITSDSFHPELNYTISPRSQHRAIILERALRSIPLFDRKRPFLRPDLPTGRAPRAAGITAGRRSATATSHAASRPRLDAGEHGTLLAARRHDLTASAVLVLMITYCASLQAIY